MKLLAAILVALAVAASAAAGSGEPKKKIVPAVQAKARSINLKLSDLPGSGWKAEASNPAESTPRCSYYNPDQSDLTENGSADSPEFTLQSGSFVASTVAIFVNAKQGRTAYSRVVKPDLPRCLAELFHKGTGLPTTIISAGRISFVHLAERSDAYRIVADVKSGKEIIRATLDFVVMNRGRINVVLFFAGIGKAFGASFERTLAQTVAARTAG